MRGSRGQHFLANYQIVQSIVDVSGATEGDTVLEIGGGLGILTSALVDRGVKVTVIEKDPVLVKHLQKTFSDQITLVNADALRVQWPENVKLIANLPYSIGTKVLTRAVHSKIRSMTVMLQEEVVNRCIASPCSDSYGTISILLQLHGEVKKVFNIHPKHFVPRPRVNSSILQFVPKGEVENHLELEELARNLLFKRNRTVRKVLKGHLKKLISLEEIDKLPYSTVRTGCLSLSQIKEISNYLHEKDIWPFQKR